MNHKQVFITVRRTDGDPIKVLRCTTPDDVNNQKDIPAYVLALCSLQPLTSDDRLVWSSFTRQTFAALSRAYGDQVLRNCLRQLLADILGGLRVNNMVGLYIHRCRAAAAVPADELLI